MRFSHETQRLSIIINIYILAIIYIFNFSYIKIAMADKKEKEKQHIAKLLCDQNTALTMAYS